MKDENRFNIGVIGSGVANTFAHIAEAIAAKRLPCLLRLAVCTRSTSPLFEKAREWGIETRFISPKEPDFDDIVRDAMLEYGVDIIALIGCEKKIGRPLLDAFPDRILNLHPTPLPRFGGKGMIQEAAQQAVIAAGESHSGPTVHIVDEYYDHGPVIAHRPIAISPDDTPESLNVRCNLAGRELYVEALNQFVDTLK